jgi:hypothetical protein
LEKKTQLTISAVENRRGIQVLVLTLQDAGDDFPNLALFCSSFKDLACRVGLCPEGRKASPWDQ